MKKEIHEIKEGKWDNRLIKELNEINQAKSIFKDSNILDNKSESNNIIDKKNDLKNQENDTNNKKKNFINSKESEGYIHNSNEHKHKKLDEKENNNIERDIELESKNNIVNLKKESGKFLFDDNNNNKENDDESEESLSTNLNILNNNITEKVHNKANGKETPSNEKENKDKNIENQKNKNIINIEQKQKSLNSTNDNKYDHHSEENNNEKEVITSISAIETENSIKFHINIKSDNKKLSPKIKDNDKKEDNIKDENNEKKKENNKSNQTKENLDSILESKEKINTNALILSEEEKKDIKDLINNKINESYNNNQKEKEIDKKDINGSLNIQNNINKIDTPSKIDLKVTESEDKENNHNGIIKS